MSDERDGKLKALRITRDAAHPAGVHIAATDPLCAWRNTHLIPSPVFTYKRTDGVRPMSIGIDRV